MFGCVAGFLGYVVVGSLVVVLGLCVWFGLLTGGLVYLLILCWDCVLSVGVCIAGLFVSFVWLYCLLCVMIDWCSWWFSCLVVVCFGVNCGWFCGACWLLRLWFWL